MTPPPGEPVTAPAGSGPAGTALPTDPDRALVPVLAARGLVKRYRHVTAVDGTDFELLPGEVLAVIGDNGAGKSTLIKMLTGAVQPDEGDVLINGVAVQLRNPLDARAHGIETVYQDLALAAAMDVASNMFLGREIRRRGPLGTVLRMLDKPRMRAESARFIAELQIRLPSMAQSTENLSGGQRQGIAVARAAAWARHVVIMDEPMAALGVKESGQVLELIARVRDRGLPVVLISHNMPHVFEIADRIHIQRLGRRVAVVRPHEHSMAEVVAVMTGALQLDREGTTQIVDSAAAVAAGVTEEPATTGHGLSDTAGFGRSETAGHGESETLGGA